MKWIKKKTRLEILNSIACAKVFKICHSIGKPQLENLCFDRAMDPIYQYTYGSNKSRKSYKSLVYSIKFIQFVSFKVFIVYIESFFWPEPNSKIKFVCIVHHIVSHSSTIFSVVAASLLQPCIKTLVKSCGQVSKNNAI